MKMKLKVILALIVLGGLLFGPLNLPAQDYSAGTTPRPIPLEQNPSAPAEKGDGTTAAVLDTVKDSVGNVVDTVKDAHWEQNVQVKSGNVYLLRRSTDDPLQPGEKVVLRFRTPTEIQHHDFLFSRNPRAQVENHSLPVDQKVAGKALD
jgi:hypothetical protein